ALLDADGFSRSRRDCNCHPGIFMGSVVHGANDHGLVVGWIGHRDLLVGPPPLALFGAHMLLSILPAHRAVVTLRIQGAELLELVVAAGRQSELVVGLDAAVLWSAENSNLAACSRQSYAIEFAGLAFKRSFRFSLRLGFSLDWRSRRRSSRHRSLLSDGLRSCRLLCRWLLGRCRLCRFC